MKTGEVTAILKKFYEGEITEEEALDKLEEAEPFELYTARLELFEEGFELEKGDFTEISKLYTDLYLEDSKKLIQDLDDEHPIRKLLMDHQRIESLMNRLDSINQEIKRRLKEIDRISQTVKLLEKHFLIEEKLIFPSLEHNDMKGETLIFEQEHNDIRETHKRMVEKTQEIKNAWKDMGEKIDELVGQIRFHTFNEEDRFYPKVIEKIDDLDHIEEEMDDIQDRKLLYTLPDADNNSNLEYKEI